MPLTLTPILILTLAATRVLTVALALGLTWLRGSGWPVHLLRASEGSATGTVSWMGLAVSPRTSSSLPSCIRLKETWLG